MQALHDVFIQINVASGAATEVSFQSRREIAAAVAVMSMTEFMHKID